MNRMLGRIVGRRRPALPRMAAFLNSVTLPPLPEKQNWYSSVASWPMLMNDTLSDCVAASVGHMIQQESIYADSPDLIMSDAEAVAAYQAVSSYVPGKPETDEGAYEGDAGHHWLTDGFVCGGVLDKLAGFADCNPRDVAQLKYSILLTGNALLGFNLPACAETSSVWELPRTADEAKSVGGHAVPAVGWDKDYLYVVSWGGLVPVSWPFFHEYIDEVHTTLSRRWLCTKGLTPTGVCWNDLVAASKAFCARA